MSSRFKNEEPITYKSGFLHMHYTIPKTGIEGYSTAVIEIPTGNPAVGHKINEWVDEQKRVIVGKSVTDFPWVDENNIVIKNVTLAW